MAKCELRQWVFTVRRVVEKIRNEIPLKLKTRSEIGYQTGSRNYFYIGLNQKY